MKTDSTLSWEPGMCLEPDKTFVVSMIDEPLVLVFLEGHHELGGLSPWSGLVAALRPDVAKDAKARLVWLRAAKRRRERDVLGALKPEYRKDRPAA